MKKIVFGITLFLLVLLSGIASADSRLSVTLADHGKVPVLSTGTTDTYIVHTGQLIDIHFHVNPLIIEDGNYGSVFDAIVDSSGQSIYIGDATYNPVDSNGDFSITTSESLNSGMYTVYTGYEDFDEIRGYSTTVYLKVIEPTTNDNIVTAPEFSNIALPVAALLGLLVISGRKRK